MKFPFTPCHQCVAEVRRKVRVGPTFPYQIHSIYLSLLSCLSVCRSVYRESTIRSKGVSSTLFIHFCNSLFREGCSKSIEFTFHLTPTTPSLFSFLFTTTSFSLFIFSVVLFFFPTSSLFLLHFRLCYFLLSFQVQSLACTSCTVYKSTCLHDNPRGQGWLFVGASQQLVGRNAGFTCQQVFNFRPASFALFSEL